MKYENIKEGIFIERPNRFIAYVEIEGRQEKVHVKNTGRCKELLCRGVRVYLEKSGNPERKTAYDLIGVEKDGRMVNMDSAAPNKAAGEWLALGGLFPGVKRIRPECTYGNSRFDFYIETDESNIWLEVKGVTLETEGAALFPDAPSLRALKHVEELVQAKKNGYDAGILFVVQMEGVRYFTPNRQTQPAFALALEKAEAAGVGLYAYGCHVTRDSMEITYKIPVVLDPDKEAGDNLEAIAAPLLKWYDGNRRILPWREDPAPYRVWISEIMLQQTRVEAVKPYFQRFMESFPDIASLADAPEDRLLKLWEGLGYYNRARNLKKAAGVIMAEHAGVMPSTAGELLTLPGIGSYTAGAVASIAYGEPVPAVDGNVLRVIARYRADDRDILDAKVRKSVEEDLLAVIPRERPGDFNQALMELGATVCIPNGMPKCGDCPWEDRCRAHRMSAETDFPQKSPKKARTIEKRTILVIQDAQRTAIRKRPEKGLLAGMYEFPSVQGHLGQEEVLTFLKEKGMHPLRISRLPDSRHIFSHKEWDMVGYCIRVDELEPAGGLKEGLLFVEPSRTEKEYPIPSAYAAYTDYLQIRLGNEKYESSNQVTD